MRDHHGGHNPAKAFTSEGAVGKEFKCEEPLPAPSARPVPDPRRTDTPVPGEKLGLLM